ncbi:hypothetical protein F5Y17DRAFT_438189 [Xylariaceae sp. FL0594]|nr:hypothetical protein F5Y17DRAFT_438189 [Xylariaceae sp. FL0594]
MSTENVPPCFTDVRYRETLHNVPKAMAELLSSYSGIPKEKQIAHIKEVRDEAYAKYHYPCMGSFRFLDLDLARHTAYKEHVLAPLCAAQAPGKPEPLFLDCGTCLGQDLRKLVADGAPARRMWASDIEPQFIESGYKLFGDADKIPRDHFLCPGDLLAESSPEDKLTVLEDRVTILHITAVFHLFGLEDQRRVVHRCLQLLRKDTGPDDPVLVVGAQVGCNYPGPYGGAHRYQHSPESWEAFWREVCAQPRWKDRVQDVMVRSKMYRRIRNDADPGAEEIATLIEADLQTDERLWHMFEVWVTFKQ